MNYIGVDLGGTAFKVGLVSNGKLVKKTSRLLQENLSQEAILELLFGAIEQLNAKDVVGIGVGVPGVVDTDIGMIYDIQNIPAWKEVPLKKLLSDRYHVRVALNNDVNCFALGELHYGKGKHFQHFVGLSIGTGLGMGIVIDQKLYNGVICGAGEIGMLPYRDGIVEQYAGSFFFGKKFKNETAKSVHEMAQKGIPEALAAWQEFGHHLGEAIKMILYMVAPEGIILGGSIAKAYPYFKSGMWDRINSFAYPKQIQSLKIEVSELENSAILGAASLCIET